MTAERLRSRLVKLEQSGASRRRFVVRVRDGESVMDAIARQPISGPVMLAPETIDDAEEWLRQYAPKVPHA